MRDTSTSHSKPHDKGEAILAILASAIEHNPSSLMITDLLGTVEYVNSAFCDLSGYVAKELIGRKTSLFESGDTELDLTTGILPTIESGNTWRGKLKNKRKDGRSHWCSVIVSPIKDEHGQTNYLSIQSDIAGHDTVEDQLRHTEARTEAIVNTAVDGIITIDQHGRIETFNRSAELIFGYRAEEMVGQNVSLLMPVPDSEKHGDYIAHYLETGERRIIGIGREVLGKRKDGSIFPIELAVSEFSVGERRCFAGVLRDISQRRKMEAALQEEQNFVSAVLATSGALIVVLDEKGRILRFNRACEQTTGYMFNEIKGKVLWDFLLAPEEVEPVKVVLNEMRAGYFPNQFESYWLSKDGARRLISWQNTALLDEAGKVQNIISTGIDITERRLTEEQMKKHQSELAHMDRLSLMGEMAATMAHELNQPLTALYAYSKACLQMLSSKADHSEKFPDALEKMAKTAEQAGLIIRRLRNFTRKQESNKIEVNLRELVDDVLEFTETRTRGRGVTLQMEIDRHLPCVWADKVQIEQVMLNLIHNSIEAMAASENQVVSIHVAAAGSSVVQITVQDTGPGLDSDQTERIFDAFYTTKPEGMGMGLAISRSIIEAHGGQLWTTAKAGQGATFHFTLPYAQKSVSE